MSKKFWVYSLGLAFLATFTLVYSQQQKTPPANESLVTKQRAEAIKKEEITRLMSKVGVQVPDTTRDSGNTSAYRQLNITLSTPDQPKATREEELRSTAASISLRSSVVKQGSLPKRRSFQLASDHLLIVTVDKQSRLRWWSTIPDPRILRAESPGPDGVLTGEVIFQKSVNFTLNVPEDSEAVEVRLYHPRSTGQDFMPVLISSMPLN